MSLFKEAKRVFDHNPPPSKKKLPQAVVLANLTVADTIIEEIAHAAGCGCEQCTGRNGKANKAMNWLTFPDQIPFVAKKEIIQRLKKRQSSL